MTILIVFMNPSLLLFGEYFMLFEMYSFVLLRIEMMMYFLCQTLILSAKCLRRCLVLLKGHQLLLSLLPVFPPPSTYNGNYLVC